MKIRMSFLIFASILLFSSCSYITDLEWIEPYRPSKSNSNYTLDSFDIKKVTITPTITANSDSPEFISESLDKKLTGNYITHSGSSNLSAVGLPSTSTLQGLGKTLQHRVGDRNSYLKFPFVSGSISSFYGYRKLLGKLEYHEGIDLVGSQDSILASGDGTVVWVGTGSGYGNVMAIQYTLPSIGSPQIEDSQNVLRKLESFKSKTGGPLNPAEEGELKTLLSQSGVKELNKTIQDDMAAERISVLYSFVTVNNPSLKDPRSIMLIADMCNTGQHSNGWSNIQGGGSDELAKVYNAMKTTSWWAVKGKTYQGGAYYNGWMARIDRTYSDLANKSYTSLSLDTIYSDLVSIIYSNEGDYISINRNDVGIFSMGICGFRAGQCADLFSRLIASIKDPSGSVYGDSSEYVYLFYAHLASASVKENQKVKVGDKIGVQGNTGGKSLGKHLHLSGYFGNIWKYSYIYSGRPSTFNENYEGHTTVDPLSSIFGSHTKEELISNTGSTISVGGASGSSKESLGDQIYNWNGKIAATRDKW